MSELRLVGHQLRYDLLVAARDPRSRFFALALPVIFLVILSAVIGRAREYLPGITTLAIVAVAFVNLVISVVVQRESGVLKRRRSTPVPAWVLVASRALSAVVVGAATVAILLAIGRVAYDVRLPGGGIAPYLVAVALGAACFCCLAYGVASFVRSEDSAQPIVQATVLPLYFISGVFVPRSQLSGTLRDVASVFPVSR